MPIYETFTKRKRRAAKVGLPDVYTYDTVPAELRMQVFYVWRDAIGGYREGDYDYGVVPPSTGCWRAIRDIVARERGVFSLSGPTDNPYQQCLHALLEGDTDAALEMIEISFRLIDTLMRKLDGYDRQLEGLTQDADDAIAELNQRFKEHGVGYRYEGGMLVRVDSEILHAEVTLPALTLLHTHGFDGPLQEFMSAHEHYRKGETKDANVDALNALESTLKTICDERKWKYSRGATASDLIKLAMREGLIPQQLQSHFEHLIGAMATGLPPVRNDHGGHGQGADVKDVGDHLSAYSLHLMAASIVVLIQAHKALPS